MISWLRARRRRAIVERPFPRAWEDTLRRSVGQMAWLGDEEASRLRQWIAVFVAEKRFEGCQGFAITDDVRVMIAAQAGLVVLGLPGQWFDGLRSVLVYPGNYVVPQVTPLGGGGEIAWEEARVGETWNGGSMVLAWSGVQRGARMRDGARSVVIHEIAHLVDLLDGTIDGVPPVGTGAVRRRWEAAMQACRERYDLLVDEGRNLPFDDYAAESPVEFFAVASECFFQDPHRLARYDQLLYDLLAEAYRQDPRSRVPARKPRA